jgi:hypothetical protein
VTGSWEHGNKLSGSIEDWNLHQLSNYQFLKDSALCSWLCHEQYTKYVFIFLETKSKVLLVSRLVSCCKFLKHEMFLCLLD